MIPFAQATSAFAPLRENEKPFWRRSLTVAPHLWLFSSIPPQDLQIVRLTTSFPL